MNNKMNSNSRLQGYKEVKIDCGGIERFYHNPLTKAFQYEYALYEVMSGMFEAVSCRSMCIESLRLFFKELPHTAEQGMTMEEGDEIRSHLKQEDALSEIAFLVERDVKGHINFPMMHACHTEVHVSTGKDGTHTFIFTDGIYGFSVRLDFGEKNDPGSRGRKGNRGKKKSFKRPRGIIVRDLSSLLKDLCVRGGEEALYIPHGFSGDIYHIRLS